MSKRENYFISEDCARRRGFPTTPSGALLGNCILSTCFFYTTGLQRTHRGEPAQACKVLKWITKGGSVIIFLSRTKLVCKVDEIKPRNKGNHGRVIIHRYVKLYMLKNPYKEHDNKYHL